MARPVAGSSGDSTLLPYMDRYTLRRQKDSGANPWRLYLHNIPSTWSFSVVLWGSYTEEVMEKTSAHRFAVPYVADCGACQPVIRSRKVRWFNWIPASKDHRITELHPGPGASGVITLFVCGPLTGRGWGFWRPGVGHVPHTAMEHTKVREEQK
jgi:hypothetical protein